jgi:plasmid stability protein
MAFPVRGLPPDVIEKLDVAAAARGMSRNAYVAEVLTQHARQIRPRSPGSRSPVPLTWQPDSARRS